ncbi:MAG: DUF2788 domain-containing protein [Cycloclasticus sp.]
MITDYISIAEFEEYALTICLTILMALMFFIVFDLARKSKGGKWAYIALFGSLCLGILGFSAKYFIKMSLEID